MVSYFIATHLCLMYNSNKSFILLIQSMTKYKYSKIVLLIYYSVSSRKSMSDIGAFYTFQTKHANKEQEVSYY